MKSPLHAIESIAKAEDLGRAIVFFLFFARFEYALKRAGYVSSSHDAKADWNRFAEGHATLLSSKRSDEFERAVQLIRDSPPKKQTIREGRLGWAADNFVGTFDEARLLILVCRIRNNLFHGGKFPDGPEDDIARDRALLEAGLTVMQECLDVDTNLRILFLDQLT